MTSPVVWKPDPLWLQANHASEFWHPFLKWRWPRLKDFLLSKGYPTREIEGYRSNERQAWLFGAGRTGEQLVLRGLDPRLARPAEPRVTNAWSSSTSAHGWKVAGKPAAGALDVCPVGNDGKPYTKDDPWEIFVALIAQYGPSYGLVHFHAPGKAVWDRPHLQLVEWSDSQHRIIVP